MLPHITRMVIDEEKRHILTNYKQVRRGGKANDTDHFTEYLDLDLEIVTEKPQRHEVWKFKIMKPRKALIFKHLKRKNFQTVSEIICLC